MPEFFKLKAKILPRVREYHFQNSRIIISSVSDYLCHKKGEFLQCLKNNQSDTFNKENLV